MANDFNELAPTPVVHGETLQNGGAIPQPTIRERWESLKGWFVTEQFVCMWADRDDHIPGDNTPHYLRTKSYLKRAEPRMWRGTALAIITLYYVPDPNEYDPSDAPDGSECPPDEIREEAMTYEQDIRMHPKFETDLYPFWDWFNNKFFDGQTGEVNEFTGIEAYLVGAYQVVWTTYSESEPADVGEDLATLQDPPGYSSTNGQQYLVVSGSKQNTGTCWSRTLVFQFNKQGWNETIYGE